MAPDERRAYQREWYARNKGRGQTPERKAYMRAYYAQNKSRLLQQQKVYVESHRDQARQASARFRARHPDRVRAWGEERRRKLAGVGLPPELHEWRLVLLDFRSALRGMRSCPVCGSHNLKRGTATCGPVCLSAWRSALTKNLWAMRRDGKARAGAA